MKKVEEYFKFRLLTLDNEEKYTTDKKIIAKVEIRDEGFVEDLQVIMYHFDKVVKETKLQYTGKSKEGNSSIFETELEFKISGVYWFYFIFKLQGQTVYVCRTQEDLMITSPNGYPNEFCWMLKVKDANIKEHPEWRGRIIYQIMPDRFAIGSNGIIPVEGRKIKDWNDRMPNWQPDENGEYKNDYFYGGNLQGIKEKLPYLKNLCIDCAYLMPVLKSSSNHHYDTEDYYQIDPLLGKCRDYEKLCKSANDQGIDIMQDMVFNHSSDKHPYFIAANSDPNSKYREYYKFQNGQVVNWYGFSGMPEFNTNNPEFQKEIRDRVLENILRYGVKAIRLDLGEILPPEFLKYIGKLKEKYIQLIFVNEMWGIATDKSNPQIFDGQADSVMNYPMTDAIIRWVRTGNYAHFKYRFERVYGEYPKEVIDRLMNILSTHDTPTAMTMLVGPGINEDPYTGEAWDIEGPWRYEGWFDTYGFRSFEAYHDKLSREDQILGQKLLKLAIAILYTIPGNPCIFMGTENAETGYKDPLCRKPMNWDNPNIPMQEFVRNMGMYRKEQREVLSQGEGRIREDKYSPEKVLILERYTKKDSIILMVNRTNEVHTVQGFGKYEVLYSENSTKEHKNGEPEICILGEYGILILKKHQKYLYTLNHEQDGHLPVLYCIEK